MQPSADEFMKRSELEHLIRAAGSIANDAEIVIIGSQSILGQFPDAPRRSWSPPKPICSRYIGRNWPI